MSSPENKSQEEDTQKSSGKNTSKKPVGSLEIMSASERRSTFDAAFVGVFIISKVVALPFLLFTIASFFVFEGMMLFVCISLGSIGFFFSRALVLFGLKLMLKDDVKKIGADDPNGPDHDLWAKRREVIEDQLSFYSAKAVPRSSYWILVVFGYAFSVPILYVLAGLAVIFIVFRFQSKDTDSKTN